MEAEFPSAHEAMSWALRRLRSPIRSQPSIYQMARKRSGFEYCSELGPWEKVAEAVYIMKAVGKVLTPLERAILQTYFTGGYEQGEEVAHWISREQNRDRWFCLDIIKTWARERPRHSTQWWAKKYGVGTSTVSRWREDVVKRLDIALQSAMTGAQQALQESGHVMV